MADTRQRILDATRRLTHQRGYGAVSIGDIAAEVGIAKGNLVYHFPNKVALLTAVAEERVGKLQNLIATWEAEGASPADCLLRLVDFFAGEAEGLAQNGCPQGTMTAELGKAVPNLRETGSAGLDLLIQFAARVMSSRLPLAEAQAQAEELVAALQGAVLLGYGHGDAELIKRHAARLRAKLQRDWG